MAPRRVLVTGASRYLGTRLIRLLAGSDDVSTVIGVDTVAPGDATPATPNADALGGDVRFVRADIRNPLIARVIASHEIDTVVHLSVLAAPVGAGGRAAMKETNIIGTMQLLAACQKAPSVQRLVLKSSSAVYGSSPRDPAMFTEASQPRVLPRTGYSKDCVEVEAYLRGFGRRRPDVALCVLRFTNIIGSGVDTALARYLTLPVVPTVLGFDPRIQLVHEHDALEVLRRATLEGHPGTYNVAAEGVLLLSQAIRRAGRPSVALPSPAVTLAAEAIRRFGLVDFSAEQLRFLEHGRVMDTRALRELFGYRPQYTTAAAFAEFARHHPGPLRPGHVALLEQLLYRLASRPAVADA